MFGKDDPVWISRLGPSYGDAKFRAVVVGISVNDEVHPPIYIVRLIDTVDQANPFDYMTITGACLDRREV